MNVGTRPSLLEGPDALERLAEKYGTLRRPERRVLVSRTVDDLLGAATAADGHDVAQQRLLRALGAVLPTFALEGANQQQLLCKVAIHLGLAPVRPASITQYVRSPLIAALATVLSIGAPATRDIAIEGLGALLKESIDPGSEYPDETADAPVEGDKHINHSYAVRLKRQRMMVLAVAGDNLCRQELFDALGNFGSGQYDVQADLLRTLPAVHRQWPAGGAQILKVCIDLLRESAGLLQIKESRSEEIQAAFARYQESVFRTIEKLIDRGVSTSAFDDVVAAAVAALSPTVAGPVSVCNRRVRATVAIITTAATLVARGKAHKTEVELRRRFEQLEDKSTLWTNPGLVEGCYRSLPMLLWQERFEPWALRGLELLLADIQGDRDGDDFVATHRGVVAGISFRRLLVELTERLLSASQAATPHDAQAQQQAEHAVRALLSETDKVRMLSAFRSEQTLLAMPPLPPRDWMSEAVLAAAAFETRTLRRIDELFQSWKSLNASRQLLLTRILAAQLRSVAHDSRELQRYPVLQNAFDKEMPTVSLSEPERKEILWHLLSWIPSAAADAVDADLQDFVEHRGGVRRRKGAEAAAVLVDDVNDLPGYVLAMISDTVSYRLAAAIAREVDLSLRRARVQDPNFDFAVSLYQMMLRGPHRAIFDHLLPRLSNPADRTLVLLFRRHVISVHECVVLAEKDRIDFEGLVARLAQRQKELEEQASPALKALGKAVHQYLNLASDESAVWNEIASPSRVYGLTVLFSYLDNLAEMTHLLHRDEAASARPVEHSSSFNLLADLPRDAPEPNDGPHRTRRQPLSMLCKEECLRLGEEVRHYIDLKVSQFEERETALRNAAGHAQKIERIVREHPGLQPPERSILVALLRRLTQLFDRTYHDYVERPRRLVETKQTQDFWTLYGRPLKHKSEPVSLEPRPRNWAADALDLERGHLHKFQDETLFDQSLSRRPSPPASPTAPPVPGQNIQFERFFVGWMSTELEIDELKRALAERWSPWFRGTYSVVTSLPLVALVIAIPCLVALSLDLYARFPRHERWHSFEGVAFFVYAFLLVAVAVVSVSPALQDILRMLSSWWRRAVQKRDVKDDPLDVYPSYQFHSLLPRLFRLIVVPLAFLVDFDHSYHFPMDATNVALLTLMVLAFLGTAFFVRREVFGSLGPAERRRATPRQVRQIVAVALVHSFAVAFLFSITFGSNYIHKHDDDGSRVAARADAYHVSDRFLGLLPREAKLDLSRVWEKPSEWKKKHLDLEFYPVLILTWTALGLFFGIFLEGFIHEEGLRGRREPAAK